MAHKQQDISPVKRSQQRNDSAKIMAHSMNLHSKPAAPERVIPEKDKHENEKLKMAHKQQPSAFSPVKRTQWPNDYGKKILSQFMDLHSRKTAAPEGAIPENDNHENENLEMGENVAKRAKVLTKEELQTCPFCSQRVVNLERHISELSGSPLHLLMGILQGDPEDLLAGEYV